MEPLAPPSTRPWAPTMLNEWPIAPPTIPQPAPILQQTQQGSPSKCGCQPKCEGEPNTNPSPNASTPTTSTSVKRATTQAPAIHYQHGELRIQHQGEGMQLGQGSAGITIFRLARGY
ncbi:hypothetical protein K443DRAFT_14897 [Laccaria amethystina LaAM-08-1]|uniref:Uncharacterized protein n=1 Tax=Laccaria amethystina LaAM-08-1 TaxID=1095629 RepID=A0A0C9WS75_9AGAR|nr:hypothetical protein K443DRAFT_14897 [Laccaria amethystina LaAM-08-1]